MREGWAALEESGHLKLYRVLQTLVSVSGEAQSQSLASSRVD